MNTHEKIQLFCRLQDQLRWVEAFFAQRYQKLAPQWYQASVDQLQNLNIPGFAAQTREENNRTSFSGNITMTYKDFYNKAHLDNDINCATLISSCRINERTGDIVTFQDGAHVVKGGQLSFCGIRVVVDYDDHDGWTDIICPTNYLWHQTARSYQPNGTPPNNMGRFGVSMQTNQFLRVGVENVSSGRGHSRDVPATIARFEQQNRPGPSGSW